MTSFLGLNVLAVTAASVALERMFSVAKNIMPASWSKKRAGLTSSHFKELIYLHEVWVMVRV